MNRNINLNFGGVIGALLAFAVMMALKLHIGRAGFIMLVGGGLTGNYTWDVINKFFRSISHHEDYETFVQDSED